MTTQQLVDIEVFMGDLMPEAPACPVPVIERRLRDAVIEACERAPIWRWQSPEIPVLLGETCYDIPTPTTQARVHTILHLLRNGTSIPCVQLDETDVDAYTYYRSTTCYNPRGYFVPNRGEIQLLEEPVAGNISSPLLSTEGAPVNPATEDVVVPPFPTAPSEPVLIPQPNPYIEANVDANNGGTGTLSNNGRVLTSNDNINNGYQTAHTIDSGIMTGSGRFYWESEILVDSPGESNAVGIGVPNASGTFLGSTPNQWGIFNANTGRIYTNGSPTAISGINFEVNDVIGHLLDLDAGTYSITVNGGSLISVLTGLDVSLTYYAMLSVSQLSSIQMSFNESDLTSPLPVGYSVVPILDQSIIDTNTSAIEAFNAALVQYNTDLTNYFIALYASWLHDATTDGTLPAAPVAPTAPGPAPVPVPHAVSFIDSGTKTLTQDSNSHLASTLSGNAMKNRGQWYWEMVIDVFNSNMTVGIAQMGIVSPFTREGSNFLGRLRQEFGLFPDGNWREFNQIEDTQTGYAQGDVIGFKMNLDTYVLEYNINGGPFIELGDSNNTSGGVFTRGTWVPAASTFSNSSITVRTNADEFTGPVPDGYLPIGLPGGLDSYDGEFEVQQSDTDVPPFNEEGYLPIRNDTQDPADNLLGHYRFFNIPGPRPEWNPTQIATISSTLTDLGETDVRATQQLRDVTGNPLLFNDPSLQAGSEYIGFSAGSNFTARDLDYVRDFQTETPVTQADIDAHAAAVAQYMVDLARFNEDTIAFAAAADGVVARDEYLTALAAFNALPTARPITGLEAYVSLKPSREANEIAKVFYDDYYDLVISGTLARLFGMADTEWTDENRAYVREQEFEHKIAFAKQQIQRGFTTKPLQMKTRLFAI